MNIQCRIRVRLAGRGALFTLAVAAAIMHPAASAPVQAQTTTAHTQTARRISARSPEPGTIFLYPERVALQEGGFATADRGIYFAPADRVDGDGEVIGIEIYRFHRSSAADPATPPIFRLHGGPSFQGLEDRLADLGWYEREILPFLEASDYVVVGQRGIGSSKPTTLCERPAAVPVEASPAVRETSQRNAAALCRSYWLGRGLDLSGLTVIQAAADVDEIRAALGYEDIQVWGGSFGSHWGMTLMRAYPDRVRRAVLRGIEGVDQTYDSPTGVLNAIAGIASAADTAAALEGLVPAGGFLHALTDVIERVGNEAPVVAVATEDGDTTLVRVDADAIRAVAGAGGVAGWPAHVLAMHGGDLTAAARAKLQSRRRPGYQTASYYMLDCGSGISPARADITLNDPAIEVVGDPNWTYRTNCPVWESDLGDDFRANFETDIPTVIVQGNWDTSTPLDNALELKPYFANLTFVLVKGGSHGALGQAMRADPSFQDEIVQFFATGDTNGIPEEVELPPVVWRLPGAPDEEGP